MSCVSVFKGNEEVLLHFCRPKKNTHPPTHTNLSEILTPTLFTTKPKTLSHFWLKHTHAHMQSSHNKHVIKQRTKLGSKQPTSRTQRATRQ